MKVRGVGTGRWSRRVVIVAVLTAVLAALPRQPFADDVDAMVSRGVELRRQGKDAEALAEFQRALQIQKAPRVQAQAALAEQALGLWSAAEEDLTAALANEADPWIKKNKATLVKALGVIQGHLGTLQIWGSPTGATVLINAKPVGTLPLKKPVRVAGDSVLLAVRADGHLELSRSVRVPPGETVREHVELIPAPAMASGTPPPPGKLDTPPPSDGGSQAKVVTPAGEPNPPAEPQPRDESPPRSGGARLRPFAWATGAGAVAGLAFGVVETFLRQKHKNAFDNYALPNPPTPNYCSVENLPAECRGLKADFDRSNTLMFVGYAVGGALAVGSAVLFALSADSSTDSNSAVACAPDMTTRGLGCRLTF